MNLIQVVFNIFVWACGISFKHCISSLWESNIFVFSAVAYNLFYITLCSPEVSYMFAISCRKVVSTNFCSHVSFCCYTHQSRTANILHTENSTRV